MMWSKAFWKAAAERAVKTGAQFVLGVLGVGIGAGAADGPQAQAVNAFALDYQTLGGAFLGGVLVSVLFSLVTASVTGTPSATKAEVLTEK